MIGYGLDNAWHLVDPNVFASLLVNHGCNTTHIELMGWGSPGTQPGTSAWGNRRERLDQARRFVNAMRRRRIITIINMVNYNVGSRKYGDKDQPVSRIPDATYYQLLDYVTEQIGSNLVVLQPLSEWSGSKAQRWHDHARAKWRGPMSWNKGSRPRSKPSNVEYLEYHPSSTRDIGPAGCIVCTDHSLILRELGGWYSQADPARVEAYALKALQAGRHFIYYDFSNLTPDREALAGIRRARQRWSR